MGDILEQRRLDYELSRLDRYDSEINDDEEDQWIEEYLAGIRNSMVQTSTPYSTKDSGDGEGEMMPDDDSDNGENYAPSDDEDDSNN